MKNWFSSIWNLSIQWFNDVVRKDNIDLEGDDLIIYESLKSFNKMLKVELKSKDSNKYIVSKKLKNVQEITEEMLSNIKQSKVLNEDLTEVFRILILDKYGDSLHTILTKVMLNKSLLKMSFSDANALLKFFEVISGEIKSLKIQVTKNLASTYLIEKKEPKHTLSSNSDENGVPTISLTDVIDSELNLLEDK